MALTWAAESSTAPGSTAFGCLQRASCLYYNPLPLISDLSRLDNRLFNLKTNIDTNSILLQSLILSPWSDRWRSWNNFHKQILGFRVLFANHSICTICLYWGDRIASTSISWLSVISGDIQEVWRGQLWPKEGVGRTWKENGECGGYVAILKRGEKGV